MSLKADLEDLRRQRDSEISRLHHIYLRTKRDVKRKSNPTRFIRRHLGATMGVAAVVGMLVAPRPTRKPEKSEKQVKHTREPIADHASQLVKNLLAQMERLIPMPKEGQNGHAKPGKVAGWLKPVLAMLASRLDLGRIISEVSKLMVMRGAAKRGGNGRHPDMSVADVGTVRADPMNDFE